MGRDIQKYVYPNPRLDRSSDVYRQLVEDAQRTGKSISDLMVIRCADYYAGCHAESMSQQPETAIREVVPTLDINKNALAAAQAWGDDDDVPTVPMRAV